MDLILKKTLLYDFYGDLLTDRQKRIYEEVFLNDYSQSEVAKDEGISRQGVNDMIRRVNKQLEYYENTLHLVEKFMAVKARIADIRLTARTENASLEDLSTSMKNIDRIASEILEEL